MVQLSSFLLKVFLFFYVEYNHERIIQEIFIRKFKKIWYEDPILETEKQEKESIVAKVHCRASSFARNVKMFSEEFMMALGDFLIFNS